MKGFIFTIQVHKNADLSEQIADRASSVSHNTEKSIPTVYQLLYCIFAFITAKNDISTNLSCYIETQLEQERQ